MGGAKSEPEASGRPRLGTLAASRLARAPPDKLVKAIQSCVWGGVQVGQACTHGMTEWDETHIITIRKNRVGAGQGTGTRDGGRLHAA